MEVRLAYGLVTEKHTDFYLPGSFPVVFERSTNNRYQMEGAFGMSGSHNYDRLLVSPDGMKHIEVSRAGAGDIDLVRRPWWLPTWLPLLGWSRWVDAGYSGSALTLRWVRNPEHFELAQYDGAIEYYLPCEDKEFCLLDGIRKGSGEALHFDRDGRRNLQDLVAPGNNWMKFTHDPSDEAGARVTEIEDRTGRRVKYGYNAKGQLATVWYANGEVLAYEYDDQQDLLSVKVGGAGGVQRTLVTNAYEKGRLASQTLGSGETYKYLYWNGRDERVQWAQMTAPDGTVYVLSFGPDGAAIRSHGPGGEVEEPVTTKKMAGTAALSLAKG